MAHAPRCLIYCPMPYSGHGWPETCVNVVANFHTVDLQPVLVTPRARKSAPPSIDVVEAIPFPISRIPWRYIRGISNGFMDRRFRNLVDKSDPKRTVAYFWPGTPPALVEYARSAGIVSVREMINTFQGMAKRILDDAYDRWEFPRTHSITDAGIEGERQELKLYDHVFAPNPEVERSLLEVGIDRRRILPTSYGWVPDRFRNLAPSFSSGGQFFKAIFAGFICVRKGVPELLDAWEESCIDGELVLVGDVEPVLQPRLARATQTSRVRHIPYTDDIGSSYRDADVFVFPTLEEGGPQVTLEAGGCGLPAIVTPMGAGRLVKDGVNGLVVRAGDVSGLVTALRRMANEPGLRASFARQIAQDAQQFTYERVSASRGASLVRLLRSREQ